jgi:hypothetical protein
MVTPPLRSTNGDEAAMPSLGRGAESMVGRWPAGRRNERPTCLSTTGPEGRVASERREVPAERAANVRMSWLPLWRSGYRRASIPCSAAGRQADAA